MGAPARTASSISPPSPASAPAEAPTPAPSRLPVPPGESAGTPLVQASGKTAIDAAARLHAHRADARAGHPHHRSGESGQAHRPLPAHRVYLDGTNDGRLS